MAELNEHINELQDKLQLLLKAYRQLQKENQRLERELSSALELQASNTTALSVLEQKLATARMSSGNWDPEAKQKLQKQIDTYLKEIDKCLALLHA
jgi:chromosome segregation ATPase